MGTTPRGTQEAKMTLLERLKSMRTVLGMTQKEISKSLGIGFRTWQNYEDGIHDPSFKVLQALAGMGFNANWILTGEGDIKRDEALREEEDKFCQLPFRDELQREVTKALIELSCPEIDDKIAEKNSFLSYDLMEVLGKGRESVPPIEYIRRIAKLFSVLHEIYESDDGNYDQGIMTSRVYKIAEKIALRGKSKTFTNEEERMEVIKIMNGIKEQEE